ncbi:hypothetical protein V6Z11_D01G115200 [Gossypium hirsutum]
MASSNTPIPMDDVFNEYESTLKRQKSTTSKVWDEMTKLECKNKNELKAQITNHYSPNPQPDCRNPSSLQQVVAPQSGSAFARAPPTPSHAPPAGLCAMPCHCTASVHL